MKRATQIALGLFSVTIGLGLAACGASGENTRPLVIGICVAAIGFIRLMS